MLNYLKSLFKPKPVKLCEDCKWVSKNATICLHYLSFRENGTIRGVYLMRQWKQFCGKRGKYWEAK